MKGYKKYLSFLSFILILAFCFPDKMQAQGNTMSVKSFRAYKSLIHFSKSGQLDKIPLIITHITPLLHTVEKKSEIAFTSEIETALQNSDKKKTVQLIHKYMCYDLKIIISQISLNDTKAGRKHLMLVGRIYALISPELKKANFKTNERILVNLNKLHSFNELQNVGLRKEKIESIVTIIETDLFKALELTEF